VKWRSTAALSLCLFGCATPSSSASSSAAARKGIQDANQLLAAAVQVGNADRVATVFADDATLLDVYSPGTIHGHAAIAEYWRKRFANTHFLEAELITGELSLAGDMAYEVGTSRAKTTSTDGTPVVSTGRYLAVWRLGGSGWRIQAECFIPDLPPSR